MRKAGWAAVALAVAVGAFALISTYVPWQTTGLVDGLTTLLPVPVAFALGLFCPRPVGLVAVGWITVTAELTNGYVNPFVLVITLGPWFAGVVVADRLALTRRLTLVGQELDAEAERIAHEAVRLERARIAHELHDVVAHCVSVMVVQAYAGERLASEDPRLAAEAFGHIADAASQAHGEIVHLVDLLAGDPPTNVVSDLDGAMQALVEGAVATGLDVELHIRGRAHLSLPATSVVYRVVQEGITNALKHAPGSKIDISVLLGSDVAVNVENSASIAGSSPLDAIIGGHGLEGLRERVRGLGGSMRAGPETAGAWRLSVRFPAC